MPLYQLVELYKTTDRPNEAIILAQKILDKEIKIPSSTINAIKNKMNQLIKETDININDSINSRTDVE
jgi:hypothetical protein